jgi:hypothetical protein
MAMHGVTTKQWVIHILPLGMTLAPEARDLVLPSNDSKSDEDKASMSVSAWLSG